MHNMQGLKQRFFKSHILKETAKFLNNTKDSNVLPVTTGEQIVLQVPAVCRLRAFFKVLYKVQDY